MGTIVGCISVTFALILIAGICCQEFDVTTSPCNQTVGNSIDIRARYSTLPDDPVQWFRKGNIFIGDCEPKKGCSTNPGYDLGQSSDGLTYFLHINRADAAEHQGTFRVMEPSGRENVTGLDLKADLTAITVSCDRQIYLLAESSATATCNTGCTAENVVLSFVIGDARFDRSSNASNATTCPSGESQYSVTARLGTTSGQHGNKSLCYRITSGKCYLDQSSCLTVEFPDQQTPGTTGNTTEAPPPLPVECDKPLAIPFLAIACVLLVVYVVIIVAFACTRKKKERREANPGRTEPPIATNGTTEPPKTTNEEPERRRRRRKGVSVLFGIGIVFALIAIVLLAVSLCGVSECRALVKTGIAFCVISVVLLIVVAILLYVATKNKSCRENSCNSRDVAMKDRRGSNH